MFAGVSSRFGIGFNFQVIGVMEQRGGTSGADEDNQIFVPLPSFQARLPQGFRNARGYTNISQINVRTCDGGDEDATKQDLTAILRTSRDIQQGTEDDFQIQSQNDILSTATAVEESFQILIASIALIALIVGGIGIMNIMLVSVTERTREIGIRKAVGARQFDILLQFLLEALVVTIIGGALGVLAAWGATRHRRTLRYRRRGHELRDHAAVGDAWPRSVSRNRHRRRRVPGMARLPPRSHRSAAARMIP